MAVNHSSDIAESQVQANLSLLSKMLQLRRQVAFWDFLSWHLLHRCCPWDMVSGLNRLRQAWHKDHMISVSFDKGSPTDKASWRE